LPSRIGKYVVQAKIGEGATSEVTQRGQQHGDVRHLAAPTLGADIMEEGLQAAFKGALDVTRVPKAEPKKVKRVMDVCIF
jgi:hypothetical protein